MQYRVYLLGADHRISAAESFVAADDGEASATAADLFNASFDVFRGYELWRGPNLIDASRRPRANPPTPEELKDASQERRLELELRLQASFACVRQSRQLMAAVTKLIDRRGGGQNPSSLGRGDSSIVS
jgi:hypothetical protein